MKRTWRKKIGAVVALLAAVAVLGTGCGADAAGAVESRTRETRALGLLLSREDTFLSELKADIEAEAAAQGYAVRYYNAGNDPETQLRQVHEALAEGVETLLVNLADGEDSEKVADIVGDAGVVLLNRAPGTAILNERMVFVGMDEAGSGALQGHALAEYFWETDHGTDIRYLLFQGMPGQENTDARSGTAVQSLLDDGFCPIAAADYQVCGFSRERAAKPWRPCWSRAWTLTASSATTMKWPWESSRRWRPPAGIRARRPSSAWTTRRRGPPPWRAASSI